MMKKFLYAGVAMMLMSGVAMAQGANTAGGGAPGGSNGGADHAGGSNGVSPTAPAGPVVGRDVNTSRGAMNSPNSGARATTTGGRTTTTTRAAANNPNSPAKRTTTPAPRAVIAPTTATGAPTTNGDVPLHK